MHSWPYMAIFQSFGALSRTMLRFGWYCGHWQDECSFRNKTRLRAWLEHYITNKQLQTITIKRQNQLKAIGIGRDFQKQATLLASSSVAGFGFCGVMVVVNTPASTNQTRPATVCWTQDCLAVQLPRVRKQPDNSETGASHTGITKPRLHTE